MNVVRCDRNFIGCISCRGLLLIDYINCVFHAVPNLWRLFDQGSEECKQRFDRNGHLSDLIFNFFKDTKTLLLPWLTIMVLSVILVTICAIVSLFYVPLAIGIFLLFSLGNPTINNCMLLPTKCVVFLLVLDLYLMLCVYALYEQMGGNSRFIV
jgi:hypothetical protein